MHLFRSLLARHDGTDEIESFGGIVAYGHAAADRQCPDRFHRPGARGGTHLGPMAGQGLNLARERGRDVHEPVWDGRARPRPAGPGSCSTRSRRRGFPARLFPRRGDPRSSHKEAAPMAMDKNARTCRHNRVLPAPRMVAEGMPRKLVTSDCWATEWTGYI